MEDPTTSTKLNELHRAATRSDDYPVNAQFQDAAPGICRICRGEGTPEEPLFYPCKCSGSIKYVHQDCLMEWLSHSQKKYCELCKTSFRFTKLYAPDMPQSLPVHVFVGHMARYTIRNLLVWLRAAMAISVWVCWLPYFMRSVWSFMFWVSDEGLGSSTMLAQDNNIMDTTNQQSSPALRLDTCPASPLFVRSSTVPDAVLSGISGQNISDFIVRILYNSLGSLGVPFKSDQPDAATDFNSENTIPGPANTCMVGTGPPSLLGDVSFLNNLTRNPTLNRTLISILEGQIITVLVIVCFILVILVRDYVVQQQPEINMRAAFAAPDNQNIPLVQLDIRDEDVENLPGPEESDEEYDGQPVPAHTLDPDYQRPRRPSVDNEQPSNVISEGAVASESDASSHRDMSGRYASEEEYKRIVRQAAGDYRKAVQIIEEEGLEERLADWYKASQRLALMSEAEETEDEVIHRPDTSSSTAGSAPRTVYTPLLNESPPPSYSGADESTSHKGKEVQPPQWPTELDVAMTSRSADQLASPSRPRAVSDGPQRQDSVHPLANNSWSFAAQPPTGEDAEDAPMPGSSVQRPPILHRRPTPPYNAVSEADATSQHQESEESGDDETYGTLLQHPGSNERNGEAASDAQLNIPLQASQTGVVQDIAGRENEVNGGLVNRVTDFMWGDIEEQEPPPANLADRVAEDAAQEDPWVDEEQIDGPNGNAGAEPEDEEDGPAAALDPEAIEDLEDFEGVMELIGMRGPVAGLFQNAIFCSVLVSVTIFACIFIPYNIGRVSVWILANPMRLVRLLFELSKLLQDAAVLLAGLAAWVVLNLVDMFTSLVGGFLASNVVFARKASWSLWTSAGSRVIEYGFIDFPMSASEMQNFSAISHGALRAVKAHIATVLAVISKSFSFVFGGHILSGDLSLKDVISATNAVWVSILDLSSLLISPNTWVIDLSESDISSTINPELAYWSGIDRFWAILVGYLTVFLIGAMYLKRGSPFSRSNFMQAWEAGVIDTLHQASGIMKVIMIISIEMLVFPLYCGLLLDGALLPLFENATFKSRILFTCNYPATSIFVHWFVGTGYMFHFALFVSMCRKIMRQGVLCKLSSSFLGTGSNPNSRLDFIRDPDDPEFHPVRDVLERPLTTQLRKILFSAFVYGALVIVCLGGVVWGLSYTMPDVLPVHYSSNEPVLEFPVDLLFYNFLMPLAVNFFKPGDGLHAMYTWWFRTCARGLRLTFFLFGERRIDEEGKLQLGPTSRYHRLPWYRTAFLELDGKYRVVPKTWIDTFEGGDAKPGPPLTASELSYLRRKKARLTTTNQLVASGHFVRAPASDRVKIPKGKKVFLDISERGERQDGRTRPDIFDSDQYQMVYIPPSFRARIFLFILFIWIFAAVTGVGFTIIPLIFGRMIFKMLIPAHIRTNDIYAFSIGVYLLGSLAYSVYHIRGIVVNVKRWRASARNSVVDGNASWRVLNVLLHTAKLVYAYFLLLVVFPLLVSAIMELYLSIPLHTYMYPPTAATIQASRDGDSEASRHTVPVVQAWTLGLLYLKLGAKTLTTLFDDTRLAVAVRAVLRRGWLHPDVGVLTRAFAIPGLAIAAAAILGPPAVTDAILKYGFISEAQPGVSEAAEAARLAIIYRQSYPILALNALFIRHIIGLVRVFHGWSARIRDEAYLIGERLHNFGAAAAGARRVRGAWRAGGARL
ncbi:hypothetical protein G7046_g6779 [Stylonectria norvegica]|nr:hypothetical protein G7046_g6779 [Stylonectria norvegica]